MFSAPGEGRECVEIARRILQEARAGVPFDEIAVVLRRSDSYVGLLEDAFDRAGIPGWFDRGTRRPHPAGRAFLAILGCAVERLSALRFAEYLSLAQVPDAEEAARAPETSLPPTTPCRALRAWNRSRTSSEGDERALGPADDAEKAVVAGALRAPWRWEKLIVESAVIGGDPERWQRRLRGSRGEYEEQLREAQREDPESARAGQLERDLSQPRASGPLRAAGDRHARLVAAHRHVGRVARRTSTLSRRACCATRGACCASSASCGRWRRLDRSRSKKRATSSPSGCARSTSSRRANRYGCVFVGSPQQAARPRVQGRVRAALAERLFPQKPREDPMLLDDEMREPLDAGLFVQEDRAKNERLLLRLAVGAPTERLWLSYPRLDVSGARPRVPSFYVLDVMRAITGRIPNHEALQRDAAREGGARLDWPAPADPARRDRRRRARSRRRCAS